MGESPAGKEVALLPSLLTTGNLLCGFGSLVLAAQGQAAAAAALIFLGMAFDILDGQVARRIGIATAFGVEYDSLADVITFGLAPAFGLVTTALAALGRWGWVSGFLFTVGAALRLARFNVRSTAEPHGLYFQGLPTPAAAGTVAGLMLLLPSQPPWFIQILLLGLLPLLALLMISNLPYRHFKQGRRTPRRLSWLLVGFAALLALAVAAPRWVLPVLFGGYTLSGPLVYLRRRRTRLPSRGPLAS